MLQLRIPALICALTSIFLVRAQTAITETEAASAPIISLITCAPGNEIYELEGHSGLRMQWDGHDVVANWGIFDFDAPNFVYRFVKGETDYCVGVHDTYRFLYHYRISGRQVTEHVLNLTDGQARRVIDLVAENIRPENRVYRYNYVKDNCATRPLAIIEKAIADSITLGKAPDCFRSGTTFRSVMRHYHHNYPWYQFGIDLALGPGLDYPITEREITFAPHALGIMIANATIADSTGNIIPLVKDIAILTDGSYDGCALPPTPWYLTPAAAMTALLLITIAITAADIRRRRISRWFDSLLYLAFALEGCVIAFLVFVSVHEASSPNYLLLWLNPLCLIVPLLIWIKRCRKALAIYHMANITAIIAYAVIVACGIQWVNIAILPMLLSDIIRAVNYICITREDYKLR